jgi:hypothetical protein
MHKISSSLFPNNEYDLIDEPKSSTVQDLSQSYADSRWSLGIRWERASGNGHILDYNSCLYAPSPPCQMGSEGLGSFMFGFTAFEYIDSV